MNRKEARWFVLNDENWEVVPGNTWIRFEILRIGNLVIGQVAQHRVKNFTEVYVHPETVPITAFKRNGYYYELDETLHTLGYEISFTSVVDRVWKEAKRLEEEK